MLAKLAMPAVAAAAAICLWPAALAGGEEMGTEDRPALPCEITSKADPRDAPRTRSGWQEHAVIRLNGSQARQTLPAQLHFISAEWDYNNAQMPYLAYMPERRRLLLAVSVDKPSIKAIQVFSDDLGKTWTPPVWMHADAAGHPDVGAATQLTYLGDGKLRFGTESRYWCSTDYGQSWRDEAPVPVGSDGAVLYPWDPMLVDRDPRTGHVVRLVETRYSANGTFDTPGYFSQGCIRFSTDEGKTWSQEIRVPQWKGVNEIALCRAPNGDLVAACRTDNPARFLGRDNDQYSGLATTVSTDNGYTWSELNHVYAWGRHHPHLVAMPNGDLVMTYVVRNGYAAGRDGRSCFGIEAVVSGDNGKTWDLDNRYILALNYSVMKGDRENWGSPQSTTNVLLPDGSLLTAFGSGVRNVPTQTLWKMDTVLVQWRPASEPGSSDRTIRDADPDADTRNGFNPAAAAARLIGYTELRTNLPGGRAANVFTMRACVVQADGSGRRELAPQLATQPNTWTQFVGWSPDGRQAIVLSGWESTENAAWEEEHKTFRMVPDGWLVDCYLLDLDSGRLANVTAVERVSCYNTGVFFWPNEPQRLGFQALINGESRPFRMALDGTGKHDLSQQAGFAYGFSAAPDGQRIAYHQAYQVYLADADGRNAQKVETGHPFCFCPTWSPDGQWVEFLSGEHYDCHPHLVRRDGSGLRKLADRGGYAGVTLFLDVPDYHEGSSDTPCWSPDSSWVYYTAKVGEAIELMRVSLAGTTERLSQSAAGVRHYHPKVSADGQWLVFGSTRDGVRQVWVARADGAAARAVTTLTPGQAAMWPSWQP